MGIVLLTSITLTTIVYSAFNTELQINGDAILRSVNEIRITNVSAVEGFNGAEDKYNSRYTKDTTSMYATLPSKSNIIFEVTITNKGSADFVLDKYDSTNSNSNVTFEILDIHAEDIISKNSEKKFKVKITNNTNLLQETSLVLSYVFEEYKVYTLTYNLDGGTLANSNPATYTKYTNDFTLNNPTRSGYEFLGWVEGSNAANKSLSVKKGSTGNKTFKATWKDVQAPVLKLSAEAISDIPFDGWTLTDATVDSDGVLTFNNINSKAVSGYIDVNYDFWYPIFEAYSDLKAPGNSANAGVFWQSHYYDSNKKAVKALGGSTYNGWAKSFQKSKWSTVLWMGSIENIEAEKRYGPNVKYVVLIFDASSQYSSPPLKIRNFKIHGQMESGNYNINITSSDNVGVTVTKYAKGNQTKDYFKTGGTVVTGNQVKVTENGIYTVYVSDKEGNSVIETVEISNIK